MLSPFSDPANEVSAPPGDFESNYRHLKSIINKALKQGTPLEDLHLIPKQISPGKQSKHLSQDDLTQTASRDTANQGPLREAVAVPGSLGNWNAIF